MMSAMEQSLRRALDAGDASDPGFRETIYAASERALERMLAMRPMDEAEAQAQRIRLAETINRVEQDYYVAAPEDGEPAEPPEWPADAERSGIEPAENGEGPDLDRTDAGASDRAASPSDAAAEAGSRGGIAVPHEDGPSAPAPTPSGRGETADADPTPSFLRPSSDAAPARSAARPRPPVGPPPPGFGSGGRLGGGQRLGIVILLVFLAFAVLAYFVYGMVYGSTSPEVTGAVASSADGSSDADEDWIALFDGTQLAAIATPSGGRVEAVTGAGARPAVRMTSAGEGSEIEVAVGPGVVGELAGETVRVEVTVGSPDGEPREFSVRCLFAGETACGRQRFTTVQTSESFVFDMTVPPGMREGGSIAFDPGFGPVAKPLDLYGVRARHEDQA